MAEFITSLSLCVNKMTAGERRLARRLEVLLENDYLVWFDIPVGAKRRYPDFIVLHPGRGILFIEVKDWKLDSIQRINHQTVELISHRGVQTTTNPLEQVRQCAYTVVNQLKQDRQLQAHTGQYQGNLLFPYGYGVVLSNITRKKFDATDLGEVLSPHLLICKDEMTDGVEAETFQKRLWDMFNYQFGEQLTLPQIDRIRWHLFPEVRLEGAQGDLFSQESEANALQVVLPDIVKVMDIQQEQLARSLGDGHRVIHGVAGSGKTLILGYRCLHLAQSTYQPILVLCFNITLAARLRSFIAQKGIHEQVHIYHFHDWCAEQLKRYHVDLPSFGEQYFTDLVDTIINAVENNQIPSAQYGAVLIDEGHDFHPQWLQLVAQMVDPKTNSLLLLYDDAQSIYQHGSGLKFSLSSVGIQARGRTTILRLNYRNTREILQLAYLFAKEYINPQDSDEDHVPIIEPESAGSSGSLPVLKMHDSLETEARYIVKCLQYWSNKGLAWRDVGILFPAQRMGSHLAPKLKAADIPCVLLDNKQRKKAYNPEHNSVTLLTIHSSKGLEFKTVIMMSFGEIGPADLSTASQARLLYVGMTRARENLLITASKSNVFTLKLDQSLQSIERQLFCPVVLPHTKIESVVEC